MKKTGIKIIIACVALVLASGILFWRANVSRQKAPEYVFYYADNQTADYPTTLGGKRFAELGYEKTDGRIKILMKSDGELGLESEVLKQMRYGGIAFARVSISQAEERDGL